MRLILASASPRRSDLLRAAGYSFRVVAARGGEAPIPGEKPARMAARLAREKAEEVAARTGGRGFVLAADTIVVLGGSVLGKPRDAAEARQMLRCLSGREHRVITAVAWVGPGLGRAATRVATTSVRMRPIDAACIRDYVSTGEPMDKAGSYAAQGIGMAFIERIRGSYTNVVGLPMTLACEILAGAGILPAWRSGSRR